MDHASNSVLRSTSQLTNHFHGMGYSGSSGGGTCGWFNISAVWKEVVRGGFVDISDSHLKLSLPRTLRRGKHRLLLWPDKEADGSTETATPSKVGTRDEMGRLEKVSIVFYSTAHHTSLILLSIASEEI